MLTVSKGTKTSGQAPSTFFQFLAFILRINAVSCNASSEEGVNLILLLFFIFDFLQKVHRLHPVCIATLKTNTFYQTKYFSAVRLLTENKTVSQTKITIGEDVKSLCQRELEKKIRIKFQTHKTTRHKKSKCVQQLCSFHAP